MKPLRPKDGTSWEWRTVCDDDIGRLPTHLRVILEAGQTCPVERARR